MAWSWRQDQGTDPADISGPMAATLCGPRARVGGVPPGAYTVRVDGDRGTFDESEPFQKAEPCDDPPLLIGWTLRPYCGPGDVANGWTGELVNRKDDEVYHWVLSSDDDSPPRFGPVDEDGTFTITGLVIGIYTLGFVGDEGSPFESDELANDPCPTPPTPTPTSDPAPIQPSTTDRFSTSTRPAAPAVDPDRPTPVGGVRAELAGAGAPSGTLATAVVGLMAIGAGVAAWAFAGRPRGRRS